MASPPVKRARTTRTGDLALWYTRLGQNYGAELALFEEEDLRGNQRLALALAARHHHLADDVTQMIGHHVHRLHSHALECLQLWDAVDYDDIDVRERCKQIAQLTLAQQFLLVRLQLFQYTPPRGTWTEYGHILPRLTGNQSEWAGGLRQCLCEGCTYDWTDCSGMITDNTPLWICVECAREKEQEDERAFEALQDELQRLADPY